MKNSIKKSITKVLLLSCFATGIVSTSTITASANQYHSTITLPRTGWWSTVNRTATADRSSTLVSQNTVSIYARIANNAGTITTPTKEHLGSNNGVAASSTGHTHGVAGASLHAQFRTSNLELGTHRVRVGWRP